MDAETLLMGPRGRRLLLCFVTSWPDEQDRTDPELDAALNVADEALDVDGSYGPLQMAVAVGSAGYDHDELMRELELARKERAEKIKAAKAEPGPLLESIAAGLARTPLPPPTVSALMQALEDSVSTARYWQHPDGLDVALADPRVKDALLRVAQHVLPACDWMERPIDRDQSWAVRDGAPVEVTYEDHEAETENIEVAGDYGDPAALQEEFLKNWKFMPLPTTGDDATSEFDDDDPEVGWCTPMGDGTVTTGLSPDPDRPGPLQLYCEEDDYGPEDRRATRVVVSDSDRVLEICSGQDWADLCAEFPRDITRNAREWSESTGRHPRSPGDGTDPGWVTPDIAAASRHYDGIHLTIAAYLACSGTAIPVPPSNGRENGASMIAGWHPDATVWLSDRTSAKTVRWLWRDEDDWPVYRYELDPASVSA
ncbi:hypothetical protein [Galactobacter sp.]|uniref:hypothetical protein n=1 Tax=Galactobacter sp. TaxID=2676125 RepID=UPI0025B905A3|nr:hypothetical protein [Galactobacter sp.]